MQRAKGCVLRSGDLFFRGSHRKKRFSCCRVCSKTENNGCSRKVGRELENCSTHGHFNNHNRTKDIVWHLNRSLVEVPFQTEASKLNQSQPSTKADRTYREVKVKFIPHTTKVYLLWPLKKRKKKRSNELKLQLLQRKTCLKVFLITRNDPQAVTPIRCFRLLQKCTLKTPPHHHNTDEFTTESTKKKKKKTKHKKTPHFAWVLLVNPL